jgi:hypothetical protein
VALWLCATLRGVGSARELARLCADHVAYQWLCGGVGMNHHTLADFRTRHMAWLDATLTASVAVLLHQGMVTLDRVAQDGVRVRASAGAASFRRAASLASCEAAAAAQVAALKAELAADPAAGAGAPRASGRRATARPGSPRPGPRCRRPRPGRAAAAGPRRGSRPPTQKRG